MKLVRKPENYCSPQVTVVSVELEQGLAATSTLPDTDLGIKESWIEGEDAHKEYGGFDSEWWDD